MTEKNKEVKGAEDERLGCNSNRTVRKGHFQKVTFEQRPEGDEGVSQVGM